MENEYNKKLNEYYDKFGDIYPVYMIKNQSVESHIQCINKCIEEGKNAFEMGYAKNEEDLFY